MAAQHLPRDLVRPSSGQQQLTQKKNGRIACVKPLCSYSGYEVRTQNVIQTGSCPSSRSIPVRKNHSKTLDFQNMNFVPTTVDFMHVIGHVSKNITAFSDVAQSLFYIAKTFRLFVL